MMSDIVKKSQQMLKSPKTTAFLIAFFLVITFFSHVHADEPTYDTQIQDGNITITVLYQMDGDLPLGAEFYKLVLDSEKKIGDTYTTIKKASQTKDLNTIIEAQKTIRDQLSYNAYQIKKIDIHPDLVQMADDYYQSLQYEIQLFDAAYMHNIGKGNYTTIQSRMDEAEGKSDEYYTKFMTDLKKNNREVYGLIKTMGNEVKKSV